MFPDNTRKEEHLLKHSCSTYHLYNLEHILESIATNVAHIHPHHLQNTREERTRKDNAVR